MISLMVAKPSELAWMIREFVGPSAMTRTPDPSSAIAAAAVAEAPRAPAVPAGAVVSVDSVCAISSASAFCSRNTWIRPEPLRS